MFIFISLVIAIIIYIISFKDDFTKENLDKILMPIYIIAGIIIVLTILTSGLKLVSI